MAITWCWVVTTDQDQTKLEDAGFVFGGTIGVSTSYGLSYSGDAQSAKRAGITTDQDHVISPPCPALGEQGWIQGSRKGTGGTSHGWGPSAYAPALFRITSPGTSTGIYVYAGGSSTSRAQNANFRIFVDNVEKASFGPFAFGGAYTFAIGWDCRTTTWEVKFAVNGVVLVTVSETASAAAGSFGAPSISNGNYSNDTAGISQIITFDEYADSGDQPKLVSVISPVADDSETGTWTPSGAASNAAAIDPWDSSTYTDLTSTPASSDRFVCTTGDAVGGTATIAAALGITPQVHAATCHMITDTGTTFQALLDVDGSTTFGSSSSAGSHYETVTSGLTGTSVIKIGLNVP